MTDLPIQSTLVDLRQALGDGNGAVLQAPPGAGKTTGVPLALLHEPWLRGQRIVMLEPRRLAARAAAHRMAEMLGETVGQTVGYRVRLDSKVSAATRIEVVTEGVLTRLLQKDSCLDGVGLVIFDEFHERSLQADLGLALCLEAQSVFREDLRLLVMSATLDGEPVARLLGGVPTITSEGRSYPVETRYGQCRQTGQSPEKTVVRSVVATIMHALTAERGDVLAFLPGTGEIKRAQVLLQEADLGANVVLAPLYGNLAQQAQDQAIRPSPMGVRKVVLATSIAETSLTIDGIRVVVDGGFMRVPRFDPRSGMTRLQTIRVTQASADQRRGRAGRLEPGVCYRCWSEGVQKGLARHNVPEILEADLAPLVLELAQWGVHDPGQLAWLDPPPVAAYVQAQDLLKRLGALNGKGQVTSHGMQMLEFGTHPRLAHMILKARELGIGNLACNIAALLGERDFLKQEPGHRDADVRHRLELLGDHGVPDTRVDRAARSRVRKVAEQWRRQLEVPSGPLDVNSAGLLLAFAYPDRIGQRRPGGEPRYRLSNGRGAYFSDHQPLSAEDYLVAAQLDGGEREARVFLAAPISESQLEACFAEQICETENVIWDSQEQVVLARKQRRLGELVLADEPLPHPDGERVLATLLRGIRQMGLDCLPWTKVLQNWRARVMFLRRMEGDESAWPDVSDRALTETLEYWLGPYLTGLSRRSHLDRLDLSAILRGLLTWEQQQALDDLAPTHYTVPSGSRIPLDYTIGEVPVLAVRLQEMFGARDTPCIAGGKVPLTLHLLSPASRPVQVTQDLPSFWLNAYQDVKKDLKGRYPKHHWPDDPLQAEPTSCAKRRK